MKALKLIIFSVPARFPPHGDIDVAVLVAAVAVPVAAVAVLIAVATSHPPAA